MSIKKELQQLIKAKGSITYDELLDFCRTREPKICKIATAERELRPSSSPNVQGYDKNGKKVDIHSSEAIVNYKWVDKTWDFIDSQINPYKKEEKTLTQILEEDRAEKAKEIINPQTTML